MKANQFVNKRTHLEKNETDIDKYWQIFKREMHNAFTKENNKIVLSSMDDKRMQ